MTDEIKYRLSFSQGTLKGLLLCFSAVDMEDIDKEWQVMSIIAVSSKLINARKEKSSCKE